jgi:hypothetical protein
LGRVARVHGLRRVCRRPELARLEAKAEDAKDRHGPHLSGAVSARVAVSGREALLVTTQFIAPNQRPGVDAGWRVVFAFQCPRPRATQAER